MGAGQIGGIPSLLDIDYNNAAGFLGVKPEGTEAQFMLYYMSHSMLFCAGALIEPHVALTPASCVYGERFKFDIIGGTHTFMENAGVLHTVDHICYHRGYNHSNRWEGCSMNNIALMVMHKQFSFNLREVGTDFIVNRIRYGSSAPSGVHRIGDRSCRFYGWGSRRNGFMFPLLNYARRVDVVLLPADQCLHMWNHNESYLCVDQPQCKSEEFGALCPDDLGSILVCSGFAQGMMTSRLIDRPCGVGFTDLGKFNKFLTCGVDDSRDILDQDDSEAWDLTMINPGTRPSFATPSILHENNSTATEPD